MKHLFTTTAMLFSMTVFAQVGINNTSPKATLDITAKTTDGSKPEGLIIPQLSGNNIRTATTTGIYGTNQKGLIVYASSADSAPTGATANITTAGYYYFDGTNWQKISTGNTVSTSLASGNILVGNASNVATAVSPTGDVTISNTGVTSIGAGKVTNSQLSAVSTGTGGIYKGSGSLAGNTTVAQNANTLDFTSTATTGTSHFTVDGNTLNVDAVNNRVGIGTSAPKSYLNVTTLVSGGTVDAGIFSIDNCGGSCGQNTARNIVLNNKNGTNGLFASLDFVPSTDPTAASGASIQGIDRDGTNNYAGLSFFTRNATDYNSRMVIKSSGNVGIANTSPQSTLDIKAISNGSSPEGIIAPRLSLTALQLYTYTSAQTGAIVYVNSASGTPAGQTANVTAAGYYYFDGTNWQKMNGAAAGDTTNDAWINDTTNGLVKLGTKADGTARAAGTDFVARDNGQVGIGTSSPNASAALDITASNKGLLIPRIALTSTTDQTTISNPATGLMIYNTATAGTAPNDVTPNLMVNNGTPSSPLWTKVVSQNTVTGTGVIGSWSGSNTGNIYTGTITSVEDGISFRSTLAGGSIGYADYASVTSGTNLISTAGSEESSAAWVWKGKDTTTVGTSFTAITQGSGTVMGSGRRTITVVNLTNGYIYRITLMIDSSNNRAFYFVEKVK